MVFPGAAAPSSWSRSRSLARSVLASVLSPQSAVLLLAVVLRAFRLDAQSLSYDEGVSAFMTTRGPAEIARAAAADIHPPLYYWLLAGWAAVFGSGEIGLRSLSVLFGVGMVAVTWRLGALLADESVGLTAAALVAVSPLAVQYGQEVRMYALAGLLAGASTWAYARVVLDQGLVGEQRCLGRGVVGLALYAALAAALLYTHYYGLLVLVAHHAHFALRLLAARRWRACRGWLAANALAAALYLPWVGHAIRQTGYYPGLGSPQPWWALVVDAVNVLALGLATTRFDFRPGLAPFIGLAALGVGRFERVWAGLLVLWLVVPVAGIVILSESRPLYEPRFLMLVLPAWAMLVAAGLLWSATRVAGALVRRVPAAPASAGVMAGALIVAALGALLVPTARSLAAYYFDPAYARDDYRGLATRVAALERPLDAVVLTAPGQAEVFGYYFAGRSAVFPLPAQRPIDVPDTRERLERLAVDHRRVWLVRWASLEADPNDEIARWLGARGRLLATEPFGRVELRLYDLTGTAESGRSPRAAHGPGAHG